MNFIADLHIHSRFSRATSKQLSPRHLAAWARCKGINVLGTGDFTHPQWRDELRQQLVRDEASGLYRLSGPAEELDFLQGKTPPDADGPLFLLQTEISSIYKRQGKVRKVHNLIFVPTLDDADRLSQRLELVGNLHSDGRPILGLDSRDLLEMTLDVCPEAVLIPAHVWTPWFALFGSKSGFDRLEDCFDDLSSHIFALETGLSSDPGMNRMVSQLDGYALISNSDAHSGANLGREANFFAGAPSYDGIFAALRAAARRLPPEQQPQDCRFLGTMEFYPEEGKYHLDGHRACGVVLEPREALALDNICPVCGKPLTIGVLHRVCELADRETPASLLHEPEARPLIPLPELVGEILGVGGLVGAQRTELMEGIFGIRAHSSGRMLYKGSEVTINRPRDAITKGIALLTEDRRASGILGVLSISDNVSVASLDQYLKYRVMLDDEKIEKLVQANVSRLSIKTPSSKTQIQSLSGGNQQKVLIARWLANDPDVLILDEPTRGIDVGAKYEIYCIIAELARQGKSIIMISSEMGELIGMSDRIYVMREGAIVAEIADKAQMTQENILEYTIGKDKQ